MRTEIAEKSLALAEICRRYDVARLEVFGSGARDVDFDPKRSDFDFLVEFEQQSDLAPLEQYFGFAEALEQLLGRPVDLVQPSAIRNPYLRLGINRSRELVYAS
jgi:predicted nucleotidyltransferase